MSDEFKNEPLIDCKTAAVLPWLPKKYHRLTVRNWMISGVKGVLLESTWAGTIPATSEGALRRFFGAVALAKLPKRTTAEAEQKRLDAAQEHANNQARRILEMNGICRRKKQQVKPG